MTNRRGRQSGRGGMKPPTHSPHLTPCPCLLADRVAVPGPVQVGADVPRGVVRPRVHDVRPLHVPVAAPAHAPHGQAPLLHPHLLQLHRTTTAVRALDLAAMLIVEDRVMSTRSVVFFQDVGSTVVLNCPCHVESAVWCHGAPILLPPSPSPHPPPPFVSIQSVRQGEQGRQGVAPQGGAGSDGAHQDHHGDRPPRRLLRPQGETHTPLR